ncbi:C4-dicarboxylate TRAP transporter substrate-binding protein [Paracoccus saliphilus]|uniref:C4-dicarboxylate TRAP transporter substrate-binding protein n=1 Tax=Paracoccus saliphilus TaxID=405559 RepID=A0AA45W2N9_9RHOB|nr:C4-dicarboxylate TRAP transporter substrate-binding protein [Paracoccus saliphilus]WCR01432.1 C4-dicarboxylate TRAP transporter substrate-binding protein [Paracoccus saliphilus]SIS69533.1 tripartite ATP-independent transporter solute receptor, DctP family [Paracoccus saliphilus]
MFARILAAATLVVSAAAIAAPAMAQDYTMRIGSVQAESDPIIKGFNKFKELVETGTEGSVEVMVYPNGQLGNTQDLMDQAQAGANVAAFTDAMRLASFLPKFGIIGAPYVFADYDEADKFTSSDEFWSWADELKENSGFVTLAFNWYQGPRNLLTNTRIESRADVEGLRIRTPGAPVWVAAGRTLGGTPTPLDWAEIYSAMQLGAIDAVEAQPAGIVGSRFYEVADYLTRTEHIQLITGIVVGETWWDQLPSEHQDVIRNSAVEAGRYMSDLVIEQSKKDFATMEENGMTLSDIDLSEFKEVAAKEIEALDLTEAYENVRAVVDGD